MLKDLLKHRIRELTAVYAGQRRVEVVRASRQWRKWQLGQAEQYTPLEGESLLDLLARLNLRPRGRRRNALILVLPTLYYTCHREHYPLGLGDQLIEAVNFDWQENIFYEAESTIHFFAPPVALENQLSVAIFAIQADTYNKIYQACNAGAFENFATIPAGLACSGLRACGIEDPEAPALQMFGRMVDGSQIEVFRFFHGKYLDSMLLGRRPLDFAIFAEQVRALQTDDAGELSPTVQIIVSPGEEEPSVPEEWSGTGIRFESRPLEVPFIELLAAHFTQQDAVRGFETELIFKPWQVPRVVWPIAAMIALFAVYSAYQVYALDKVKEKVRAARQQVTALEKEWKPIEELQTRITKFQQDQKTLAEFNTQNVPLRKLLNHLSNITPEDTWLNYLSLREGKLILRGESKSAIKYLSELTKVEGFSDVRFASPVTKNPSSDQERFNLQLQVDTAKLMEILSKMPKDEPDEEPAPEQEDTSAPKASIQQPPNAAVPGPDQVAGSGDDESSDSEEESTDDADSGEDGSDEEGSDEEDTGEE